MTNPEDIKPGHVGWSPDYKTEYRPIPDLERILKYTPDGVEIPYSLPSLYKLAQDEIAQLKAENALLKQHEGKDYTAALWRIQELTIENARLASHNEGMIKALDSAAKRHPEYGPCDGLLPDGGCSECDNIFTLTIKDLRVAESHQRKMFDVLNHIAGCDRKPDVDAKRHYQAMAEAALEFPAARVALAEQGMIDIVMDPDSWRNDDPWRGLRFTGDFKLNKAKEELEAAREAT